MLVYTQKGMDMLSMLQNFVLKEIPLEHVLHNASYLRATPAKKNRKAFGNAFASGGLSEACNLYSCRIIEFKEKCTDGILGLTVRAKRLFFK